MSVVVCIHLKGKMPHRQESMGIVMTSGRLCYVMVSTLAWNARDADSILILGVIFPIFVTPSRTITTTELSQSTYKLLSPQILPRQSENVNAF